MPRKVKALPPAPPAEVQAETRPTPMLNEQGLINALNPDSPITPDGLRTVTLLSLFACFDRKVERQFFVEMLEHMGDMFTLLRDYEEGMIIGGNQTPPVPRVAINLKHLRSYFAHHMALVAQCPTAADKVS